MTNKPVLLIGLGGTGSEIVTRIYNEIPENEKNKVIVHIFDTNVNDMATRALKSADRTLISSDLTVEKCLLKDYIKKSNASDWFPTEHPSVLKTKFSDGAGQVRVISRLAYLDAIGSGKLNDLEKKLSRFSEINGSDYDDVRVMIVSSLAGGTGSGIFLQTGLFLKDYFESRNKGVTVRGAFLLPDIFVKNGISTGKENNMYANGYACLKELDAIIKSTMGTGQDNNVNIQLAYKPEMPDEKVTFNPYDYIFLYDYENVDGKHLADFNAYKEQISKTLYLQLFSDIAGASDSDEINMLNTIVENDGRARYASSGVATMVYPYEAIVKYCTNRLASEKIGTNWLKLDTLYDFEIQGIENDKKLGIHREPLKKHIRMNELFDAQVKENNPFFKNVNRTLHMINSENELGDKKTDRFISAVETKVVNDYQDAKEFQSFRRISSPKDEALFGKNDKLINVVQGFEANLSKFKRKVLECIDDKKNLISSVIVPVHVIDRNEICKDSYQLAYWILGQADGVPLQPVATRYFLYDLKNTLEEKIKYLRENTSSVFGSMEQYEKNYEDGNSASAQVEVVATKRVFLGLFGKHCKTFATNYKNRSTNQFKQIEKYGREKILLGVYEDLLKAVDDLLVNGEEMFFAKLKEIITDFTIQAKKQENEHEDKTDVSKVFVLADANSKKNLYERLIRRIDVDNILENSYKDIFLEEYYDYTSRRKNEIFRRGGNPKERYKKTILNGYESKIKSTQLLDFDVITALKKEIEFNGYSYEEEKIIMEEKIMNVKNRAKPFMLNRGDYTLDLWGINPIVLAQLSDDEKLKCLGETSKILASDGFSKYEIIRYSSIMGLKAQEFTKFASANSENGRVPGAYFAVYKDKIDRLSKNELTITPHLDKRWHYINYMPDINDDQAQKDKNAIMRGFIYGLLFENIVARMKEGAEIWVFKDINGNAQEIKNGDRELKAEYPILFTGLGNNPFIVDEIKKIFNETKEKGFGILSRHLEEHLYIKLARPGSVNFIDILIKYVSQSGRAKVAEAEVKVLELLEIFMQTTREYIEDYYTVTREKTVVEVYAKYMYAILNNSAEYKNSDKNIGFIENIVEKINANLDSEYKNQQMIFDKVDFESLTFDNLVKFIKERN